MAAVSRVVAASLRRALCTSTAAGNAVAETVAVPAVGAVEGKRQRRVRVTESKTLQVTGLDLLNGDAVGKSDDGTVAGVWTGVPGSVVQADVVMLKDRPLGTVSKVLSAGPHHVQPRCSLFGTCGGCRYQNVSYTQQLAEKQRFVQQQFVTYGFPDAVVKAIIPSPDEFHYRTKMEFSCGPQWLEVPLDADGKRIPVQRVLGLHPRRTTTRWHGRIAAVGDCPLQTEFGNTILRHVQEAFMALPESSREELQHVVIRVVQGVHGKLEAMVHLQVSNLEAPWISQIAEHVRRGCDLSNDSCIVATVKAQNLSRQERKSMSAEDIAEHSTVKRKTLHGSDQVIALIGQTQVSLSPMSFSQSNLRGTAVLYDAVAAAAGLQGNEIVWDLFCGAGTIGMHVSRQCAQVVGIEIVADAVRDAQRNAELNGISNIEFLCADLHKPWSKPAGDDASDIIMVGETPIPRPDVVIVDPPRVGCFPHVLKLLCELKVRRLVYVSCNPDSLGKDVQALVRSGAYKLVQCTPVDMFPQTNHVEAVCTLEAIAE